MNILPVDELNKAVSADIDSFIEQSEDGYRKSLEAICEQLRDNRFTKPIVLLSGPSGSGKTTTALRMETILDEWGCETHTISMDNYFLPLTDPKNVADENGKIDLEAPQRLDIDLFKEHLQKISNCEPIDLPGFDFGHQARTKGNLFCRKENELVIFEGIHALNPMVTGNVSDFSTNVYVSVRTRLEHNGQLLHPSKIRLMRRLMRDKLFRGRKVEETMNFFRDVQRGEKNYIMPFKKRAQFDVDTFIPYEASIYKDFLLPQLERVSSDYENYSNYSDIEFFLKEIEGIDINKVPKKSLIREFVGGSHYIY